MKHVSTFKRLKPIDKYASIYNGYKPNDGIIIEFENPDSRLKVLLTREMANNLAMRLNEAEFSWHFHETLVNNTSNMSS